VRLPNGFMPARQGLPGAFGLPSHRSRLPCSQGTVAASDDVLHRAPGLQKLVAGAAFARVHAPRPYLPKSRLPKSRLLKASIQSSLPQGTALSVALSGAGSEVLVAFALSWAGAAAFLRLHQNHW
jgi:hypothetical protein